VKKENPYDQKYAGRRYYWGKKPQAFCDKVIEIIRSSSNFQPKLLDLGCGEGRNAVYFAQYGFKVFALDLSLRGLEKAKRYAEEVGVHIETIHADIVNYEPEDTYDVIFSTGTLHYLPPEIRSQRFQQYKDSNSPGGINAISVFVEKPFTETSPDPEESGFPYKSGELMSYYWDWEILYCTEKIFDCMSGDIAHKHVVNRIIARRGLVKLDLSRFIPCHF